MPVRSRSAAAALAAIFATTAATQQSPPGHWVIQPPAAGIYTGATGGENSGEGSCEGVGRATGRTMQFCVNNRFTLDNVANVLRDGRTAAMSANGTIPLISMRCNGNGTPSSGGSVTFGGIAAGEQDAKLQAAVAALKAYAARFPKNPWIMMRPFHEFNLNTGNPPADPNKGNCYSMPEDLAHMQTEYVAAFRHVVTYFIAHGATNVTWLWCPAVAPVSWKRRGGEAFLRGFYPGDAYVDWTCADTYDKEGAHGGFQNAFTHVPFFAEFHKPLIIAETAECNADNRSERCARNVESQADFINELGRALQPGGALAGAGIKAWLYFDQSVPTAGYNWSFDRGGLAAFRALINTPYFHPAMPHPRWQPFP